MGRFVFLSLVLGLRVILYLGQGFRFENVEILHILLYVIFIVDVRLYGDIMT